ncbi:MAG: hypothetical protein KDM63_02415 [Verrucomicrobiae bacterium]|nr:hypothetical protein [Verrucomicrobiae bacterium]MCB1085874.1 hypothetical protein [Verrucomicrobiae bacterium]
MKTLVVIVAFSILAVLHQDTWFWSDRTLWFGFLPAGLGYHAAYSLVVALFWFIVSQAAWPDRIEKWADESDEA